MNYHHVKMKYMEAVRLCKSGQYIQAKNPLKWVLTHSRKYKALHLESGQSLAGVYKKLSEYDFAIRMLEYLIELYEADSNIQSILNLDLATAKFHRGDHAGADRAAFRARRNDRESLNPRQLSFLLMLEGRYFSCCGKHSEAINCQERAWLICEEIQSKYRMMQAVSMTGQYLMDLGDDLACDQLTKKALEMACNIGAQFWASQNYLILMQLAFKKGDILDAKEFGKRCFMLAYRNGYRRVVEEACQSTGDYYRAIGDTEVADVFYQKAVSVGSESPSQVLEKVDRIYDTAYSQRRLNVKFTSSGNKWVVDESTDSSPRTVQAGKALKYRYIIGSAKTRSLGSPPVGGRGEGTSNQ